MAKEAVLRNAFDATKFCGKKGTSFREDPGVGFEKNSTLETPFFFLSFLFHAIFKCVLSLVLEFGDTGYPYQLPSRLYHTDTSDK